MNTADVKRADAHFAIDTSKQVVLLPHRSQAPSEHRGSRCRWLEPAASTLVPAPAMNLSARRSERPKEAPPSAIRMPSIHQGKEFAS